jgi:hypothetical protein
MKYELLEKRYLTILADMPFNHEYPGGTMFNKLGQNGTHAILEHDGNFIFVSKKTLRADFKASWGGINSTVPDRKV